MRRQCTSLFSRCSRRPKELDKVLTQFLLISRDYVILVKFSFPYFEVPDLLLFNSSDSTFHYNRLVSIYSILYLLEESYYGI